MYSRTVVEVVLCFLVKQESLLSDGIDVNEGLGTHVDRGDVNLGLAAATKGL
jgi:hypothetical protein